MALTEQSVGSSALSFRLIGWSLWDKYDKSLELLRSVLQSDGDVVASDAVSDRVVSEFEVFSIRVCTADAECVRDLCCMRTSCSV